MLKNILFTIVLLLSSILGAGGLVIIANSIMDDRALDPILFLIGMVAIFLWMGTCALLECKYFTEQRNAMLKFFGLTANEE